MPELVPKLAAFELHAADEVVSATLAAGPHDLAHETRPVLHAVPAVLVVSVVVDSGQERVDEVVVVAVELDAVEAGLLGPLRGVGVAHDDGLDLGDGEGLELPGKAEEQAAHLVFGECGGHPSFVVRMLAVRREERVGTQMVDLEDDGAAVLVHCLCQPGEPGDAFVVEDPDRALTPPFRVHDRLLHDDAAHTSGGQRSVEVDVVLGDGAVFEVGEVHVLGRLDYPVPELLAPDGHRLEDVLQTQLAHVIAPVLESGGHSPPVAIHPHGSRPLTAARVTLRQPPAPPVSQQCSVPGPTEETSFS